MTVEIQKTSFLDSIIEKGILFLLIFTPLAFGAVQDWAAAVMELVAFLVLAAWLLKAGVRGQGETVQDTRLLTLFGIIVLVILLQLIPLPQELLRKLTPSTADIYSDFSHDSPGTWRSISLYPWATQQYLLKLLAYVAVFFVIINHYRDRERVERLVRSILFLAFSLVVFAFLQKATWNGRIFWLYPIEAHAESERNFAIWGPFINRNHFAGYLEMVIPLGLAMVLYHASETDRFLDRSWTGRLASFISSRRFASLGLWGTMSLVMAGALFMTLSRGGIIAFLLSMTALFLLARMRRGLKKRIGPLAFIGLALLLMIMTAGWDKIEERFEQLGEEQHLRRAEVWKDSLQIVKDFPLLGTGFGTFGNIYPKYQTHSSTALYDHAHNDYVEMLTDMGLLGFAAFGALCTGFVILVFRQWLSRHRAYVKAMGAGGMASCGAMFIHGMTDFNLHIPSNAMLLTVVAGITWTTVFNVGRNEV